MSWERSSFCSGGQCAEVNFEPPSGCSSGACVEVAFAKSSFCSDCACVEVGQTPGRVLLRDGKLGAASPVIEFSPQAWAEFLELAPTVG